MRSSSYYNDLIDFHIRKVFRYKKESIYDAFALFIRNEVFFTDGKVCWFLNNICTPIDVSRLTPRLNAFIERIERVSQRYLRIKERFQETVSGDDDAKFNKDKTETKMYFDIVKKKPVILAIIASRLDVNRKFGVELFGVAYRDGIVLVNEKQMIKREVYMEDHMFTLGQARINSPKNFHWRHPLILDILKCFRQVFVEEENVQWFLRWLASLHAKKPERIILILHGKKGGNAKTKIFETLLGLLGKYCMAANEALLYEDPASTCSPYTADLEGKVLLGFSDAGMKKPIPSNIVKARSGGDFVTAAAKYKDPKTFASTAKIVIMANSIPAFDIIDAALADCIFILECIGRYVKDAPISSKVAGEEA